MIDILLAHGYFLADDRHEQQVMKPYPPLGLLYLSAYLKAHGLRPQVFDSTFQTRADFRAILARVRPPVVGLYGNLLTRPVVLSMIAECRAAGAYVVLGGPEPAQYADEFLAAGADVVVAGEGEQTLTELLIARQAGQADLRAIPGLIFRDAAGQVVRNPPRLLIPKLDTLPFPDRAAIDLQPYLDTWKAHHGVSSVSLITARGCAYHCAWCSHAVYGETHRRRSPANVVAEVEAIVERYQPDQLWYADDVFTIHHRWLFQYAALLKERGLRLPFECISRADRLNEAVVATLAEMGCYRLWIGSESGSQRILDAMRREVTVEEVQAAIRLLRRYGIATGLFIMLGYEGEELADLKATVEHLKQAAPDVFLTTVAYPIKGTPYFAQVEDRLQASRPWAARTERDWIIRGRHSPRYYRQVTRWMVNAVALHRQWQAPRRNWPRLMRAAVNTGLGRLGMALTAHERT